ncbi:MAG TPA: TRAP transporter small permease [Azospirillum sp.]|nr:TRAP transporter small permease [Azospirillum sp.]
MERTEASWTEGTEAPWLARLDHTVDVICKAILCVTCTAIFLILICNVVLRYFFASSLEWAAELPELLFPWFVIAGVVLAASHNAHIQISFLVDRVGPATTKALAVLRAVLIFGVYGLLSWVAMDLLPIVADERSPVLGVPNSVTYAALLFGFALIGLKELTTLVRGLHGLRPTPEMVPFE